MAGFKIPALYVDILKPAVRKWLNTHYFQNVFVYLNYY